jgi:hypothetical protein
MNKNVSYTKKAQAVFYSFSVISIVIVAELFYINANKSLHDDILEKKIAFVQLSGLPDLAVSTEASYIRHRSLSTVFSIYKDDGSLREYFPSTYTISHSHILNQNAAKSKNEK